jgi:dTDP-4-dehydrorhamnose 3,5-epimerase-like enzyme
MNTIDDIFELDNRGPWQTKSNAELNVLFALDYTFLQKQFFNYDKNSTSQLPVDIRGLRSYKVSGIQKNSIGANEWHKVRNEMVITTRGIIEWELKDLLGNNKKIILGENEGIFIPNHILHTYKALKDNSTILVIANTLFNPEDPLTHDTYGKDLFLKQYG